MVQFPLADGSRVCVIDPGNIMMLKRKRPLRINEVKGDVLICYTPDLQAFMKELGLDYQLPKPGDPIIKQDIHITTDRLMVTLTKCADLPEKMPW